MRNLLVLATRLILRKTPRRTCAIVFALLAVSGTATAGIIVAAGDATPVFSLTDTVPNPATAGNQQFFSNVLGSGTSVLVQAASSLSFAGPEINEFYNTLAGVTSTLLAAEATVTGADLAGKNLFLAPNPDAFTTAEIAALGAFVGSGGSLYVMGDGTLPSLSADINALLAGIGSNLSLGSTDFDEGDQTASGPEIVANALTSGVLSFNYGATVLVSGGSPLFLTNGLQPFVAVEDAATTVPEPATVLLFSAALVALGITRMAGLAWAHRRHYRRTRLPAEMTHVN
jgi:hypothetical protein